MNGISGFSSQLRLTGLSGFDTESIVQELMRAERIPLDALKQKRTLLQWKQEAYREISSSLIGFKSKFFDIVNRSTYMLSENSIKLMSVSSSNSAYVTATASAYANAGEHTIKILQAATAAKSESAGEDGISKAVTGTIDSDNIAELAGKKIIVSLDGTTKEITLGSYANEAELAQGLQQSLNKAFGESKIIVELNHNETDGTYELSIDTLNGATRVTLSDKQGNGGLAGLGIISGASNRISMKSTLASLSHSLDTAFDFDDGGFLHFSINGQAFSVEATDTLEDVFRKINSSEKANVTIKYNEITDKVTIEAKQTGAGSNLVLDESATNFFGALKLGTITEGKDAEVLIDGTHTIVRSTNTFTVNNITYNIKKAHDGSEEGETISISQDTETVINNFKSFIEEYNKLIDSLNARIKESYNRNYLPLTDAQKAEMEEKDIENWEKEAKKGLLRNDSLLQEIVLSMRKALYEKVEGVNLSLADIGISSKSYTDYGKLYLDENKLKNALLRNPDEVTRLINGVPEKYPNYSRDFNRTEKEERYRGSGVFQRLADIIEDNVSVIRDADNKKGRLLEKAGLEGDLSNTKNILSEELDDFDGRINSMIERLIEKEENYYRKFSRLETFLNQMNQQSLWIMSQFGVMQ